LPKPVPNTQTGSLTDHERGTNDVLKGVDDMSNTLYGDAFEMLDHARGGNDLLIGGAGGFNQTDILVADASVMDGRTSGGNDTLIGGVGPFNVLYGDANAMHGGARGGNDLLIGGDNSAHDSLIGDASTMDGNSRGGNDTLIGGDTTAGSPTVVDELYGDAFDLQGNARGGNDHLVGGNNSLNLLFGDGGGLAGDSRGGNDVLVGGNGSAASTLIGDATSMSDNARGGNDVLISGTGTDHMWGDAEFINGVPASPTAPTGNVKTGADTFVFAPHNGNDDIMDFRQSDHDKIDVRAYGFHSLADMVITGNGADTKIAFDADDSVTLVGFSDPNALRASDFIFQKSLGRRGGDGADKAGATLALLYQDFHQFDAALDTTGAATTLTSPQSKMHDHDGPPPVAGNPGGPSQ
jgi:serralysin